MVGVSLVSDETPLSGPKTCIQQLIDDAVFNKVIGCSNWALPTKLCFASGIGFTRYI